MDIFFNIDFHVEDIEKRQYSGWNNSLEQIQEWVSNDTPVITFGEIAPQYSKYLIRCQDWLIYIQTPWLYDWIHV